MSLDPRIDMDNFKRLNDQHGHRAGDQVLRQVQNVADRCLRRADIFGRYGRGILPARPETDQAGALILAERLRQAIEECHQRHGIGTTASIGVATLDRVQEDTALVELIDAANQALDRAKAEGRNRVTA